MITQRQLQDFSVFRVLATHYNLDFQIWKLYQPDLGSEINFIYGNSMRVYIHVYT